MFKSLQGLAAGGRWPLRRVRGMLGLWGGFGQGAGESLATEVAGNNSKAPPSWGSGGAERPGKSPVGGVSRLHQLDNPIRRSQPGAVPQLQRPPMPSWRRTHLHPGLYDEPVSEHLRPQLAELGPRAHVRDLPRGEAAVPGLEAWLGEALNLALQSVAKAGASPADLVHDVLAVLERHAPAVFSRPAELTLTDQWLQAVTEGAAKPAKPPKGSLHAPSLLVNAEGEHLLDHLRSEFDSADRVDLLCAFIKLSGFEPRPCVRSHRPVRCCRSARRHRPARRPAAPARRSPTAT